MKRTHFIELIVNIRKTMVSCVSIFVFVVLGIAIFLSFSWVGSALNKSTNQFITKYKMHDLDIVFPIGFSEEDINEIKCIDGVSDAEGRRCIYDFFMLGNRVCQAKLTQITKRIDRLNLIDGSLPEEEGEIAIDAGFAKDNNIKINDTVVFNNEAEGEKYLKTNTFIVTALVSSPEYAAYPAAYGASPDNGIDIDCAFWIDESSVNESAFLGYTDVVVTCDELAGVDYMSDEYKNNLEAYKKDVFEKVTPIVEAKQEKVMSQKKADIDAISTELADKKREIDEANAEIEHNQKNIDEGEKKLAQAKKSYL